MGCQMRGKSQLSIPRKMKLQHSILYLCAVLVTALAEEVQPTVLNPRGARPIEHGFKADKCATEKEWPFCMDEDWGNKCPSGCRIQGLLDETDLEILSKIEKIRNLLNNGKINHRSADQDSKNTYNYLREKLVLNAGNDNRYANLAEQLRQRIVEIKIRIDRQLRLLEALKSQVKTQVTAMQRLEVDIDIKLRSCKGSCASYGKFSVDKESYVALDKQMERLDTLRPQSVETVSSLRVMKSRPMKDELMPSIYKSKPTGTDQAEQRKAFFTEVEQMQLSLEAEGSTAETAATVSKVSTGTGPSTPFSTSRVGTQSLSCSKTIRKVVTETKDGTLEKFETVTSGGPGCDAVGKLNIAEKDLLAAAKEGKEMTLQDGSTVKVTGGESKSITTLSRDNFDLGGLGGDFFKGLGGNGQDRKLASSSSSSSSKTILTGSTKGFVSDTKSILSTDEPDFGEDLGAFLRGEIEDDLPDIHARSLKSRDERKADFIGGDCLDIQQNHAKGGQSGLFKIKQTGSEEVAEVYCDQATGLGGWVLVQQREDGSVNFNRTWDQYRVGFGKVDEKGKGEYWIGNKFLHLLTQNETLLRVEMQDWDGKEAYAEYNIQVGPESEAFKLSVSSYMGDAGDALFKGHESSGSSVSHDGMKFSTFDKDNDRSEENCADMYGGGWWFNNCYSANLNGVYYNPLSKISSEIKNGVVWQSFRPNNYSLKVVRMMIRPA